MKRKNHYSFDYWCRAPMVWQPCCPLDWAFCYDCEWDATGHPSSLSSLSFEILDQHSKFSMTGYTAISILIDPDFAFALSASSGQRCSTSLHRLKWYCSFWSFFDLGFKSSSANSELFYGLPCRPCIWLNWFEWKPGGYTGSGIPCGGK